MILPRLKQATAARHAAIEARSELLDPRLSQDLLALGVTPEEVEETPRCSGLPDLSTTARLFGCLQVIEGATLGGQIVTRHLHASLGVTPGSGGGFFSGHAEHTGSRWKAFGTRLSTFALQSGREDEILAGANETFETLDQWLYRAPRPGVLAS